MISLAATLLLALQAAPAPGCEVTDNACKAREFIDKARTATPAQRAMLLFTAHKSYLALFAQTGKVADLCAARASFDRSLGVKGQGDSQRIEKARAELEALEQRHGARCSTATRRRKPIEATPIVLTNTPVVESPPVDPPETDAASSQLAVRSGPAPIVPVPPPAAVRSAQLDQRGDLPARAESLRSRPQARPMLIAGGTTLGVGLVLAGVAVYGGAQLSAIARENRVLFENALGRAYASVLPEDARLRGEYHRWLPVTVATTIASTSAVVVGAVLVSLGVRRLKNQPSRAALVPTPGGLAIHARF
jgi:hypothetical protein